MKKILSEHKKYISLILVLSIVGFTIAIIFPFIVSIITSTVFAYIFYPLYLKIKNKVKKEKLSALLTTIIITLLIIIPFIAIINGLAFQAKDAYSAITKATNTDNLANFQSLISDKLGLDFNISNILSKFTGFIGDFTKDFLAGLPNKIVQIFLFFFLIYYFFKEGPEVLDSLKELLPISKINRRRIVVKLDELLKAIVHGSLITAAVQGMIGGIGFLIFGIGSPLFWGFLMAIFALIPFVGTGIIWLPASLILIINGILFQNGWLIAKGIGLILYGTFIISLVDNLLKPYLIGDRGKLHPALVLLGILGGISLMGFIGIIIGPIIIALFLSLVELYRDELNTEA